LLFAFCFLLFAFCFLLRQLLKHLSPSLIKGAEELEIETNLLSWQLKPSEYYEVELMA